MEIRNEIKQKDEEKKEFVHRSLADVQRAKLSKLMSNPEKPVVIPDFGNKKEKEYQAPSFVRNVMGSSAGAGSGEFHVYRHLRRKEYSRQKYMKALTEAERLDKEFQEKLEENQRKAEEKTNKKREKRKKKKMNQKNKSKKPKVEDEVESEELSEPEMSEEELSKDADESQNDNEEEKLENQTETKEENDAENEPKEGTTNEESSENKVENETA